MQKRRDSQVRTSPSKVDLRGFEPLTSAMRTRRSPRSKRPFLNPALQLLAYFSGANPQL